MPKSVTVFLGGQEYVVESLPIRASKQWRQKLAVPFGQLAGVLEGAGEIDLSSGRDLAALLGVLNNTVIGSVDVLLDLLFEYSSVLAEDRERIEAEAYDEEALTVLVEVLKLAYPFGVLKSLTGGGTRKPTT